MGSAQYHPKKASSLIMDKNYLFLGILKRISFLPALIVLLLMSCMVMLVVVAAGGNPLDLVRIGTFYDQHDPAGSQGYDGQFVYYIARNIHPRLVADKLDVPAYRYQRILMPLLGRVFALGKDEIIPWTLPVLGIIFQAVGTWIVAELLVIWGVSVWYSLVYGLWVGFTLAIRLDLPEPIAYACVAGAILAEYRKKNFLSWILFGLALFAKEVTIVFVAAALVCAILQKRKKDILGLFAVSILPYAVFQCWLWLIYGEPGIGSGGAMATPFEVIPFMGFIRILLASWTYGLAMLFVFGSAIIFPAIWGMWVSIKKWISAENNILVFSLLFNALVIVFLPFSTVREPGGLLRFACGLVMSVLLFAAYYRINRALRYSWLWLVLNIFLLKGGS